MLAIFATNTCITSTLTSKKFHDKCFLQLDIFKKYGSKLRKTTTKYSGFLVPLPYQLSHQGSSYIVTLRTFLLQIADLESLCTSYKS